MTKSLTEKWKDGELFGFHYVKVPKEKPEIHNVSCMDYLLDEYGVEVLAPVPSYDECKANEELLHQEIKASQQNALKAAKLIFEKRRLLSKNKQLQKQLKEANKLWFKWYESCCEAEHQLYDANQIISEYRCYDDTEFGKATQYCKKWGVK